MYEIVKGIEKQHADRIAEAVKTSPAVPDIGDVYRAMVESTPDRIVRGIPIEIDFSNTKAKKTRPLRYAHRSILNVEVTLFLTEFSFQTTIFNSL